MKKIYLVDKLAPIFHNFDCLASLGVWFFIKHLQNFRLNLLNILPITCHHVFKQCLYQRTLYLEEVALREAGRQWDSTLSTTSKLGSCYIKHFIKPHMCILFLQTLLLWDQILINLLFDKFYYFCWDFLRVSLYIPTKSPN